MTDAHEQAERFWSQATPELPAWRADVARILSDPDTDDETAWRRANARTALLVVRGIEYAMHGQVRTTTAVEIGSAPESAHFRAPLLRQWRGEATRDFASDLPDRQVWDREHQRSFALVKRLVLWELDHLDE